MFVPVLTKDMQIFQQQANNRQHAATNIKNVRSRAQSLEKNLNKASGAATSFESSKVSAPISASTASVHLAARNRVMTTGAVSSRTRNSQSVGSLPTTSSLAVRQLKNTPDNSSIVSRSPPKISVGKLSTLDPIVEGIPLVTNDKENDNSSGDKFF